MKQNRSFDCIFPELSDELKGRYLLQDFKTIMLEDFGGVFVFFCGFSSVESMDELWEGINSFLAVHLAKHFESDFQRWNVYIFMTSNKKIPPALQYKIENDTFFSRKIVLKNNQTLFNDENISEMINGYILNSDIDIGLAQGEVNLEYSSESLVYDILTKENIDKGKGNTESIYNIIYKTLIGNRK
ncbi:ABC-three component system middle component 1 [Photobacterium sanguinicancri]|uniref:Uncharacterized protein n=1 Tax=Photobacterium sanguinicancri TaxID=875932 RepID=A0AAW7YDW3_9GAMM|nr:ABC-three component system middle component 1 [Photobacterium sanguinicancri]MDO6545207.1 hypothetical protein [Photobacterium sanguinicancri]